MTRGSFPVRSFKTWPEAGLALCDDGQVRHILTSPPVRVREVGPSLLSDDVRLRVAIGVIAVVLQDLLLSYQDLIQ